MTVVDDLVAEAMDLLERSEAMNAEVSGNRGQTPKLMTEKASILANIAVATAISSQQASAAAATAQAITEARDALRALTDRVVKLEAGRVTLATAVVDLGALVIGTKDYTLDWGKSLGDASYQLELLVDDVLVGRATAVPKVNYATSAIVTVKTSVAVLTATKLQARAWRGL